MKATQLKAQLPAVIGIALVAAALGYIYFGLRGITLWVPVALVITAALHLLLRRFQRSAMALALLVAAVAFGHASTIGWGGANGPDGTRYQASPIGLVHVATPHQSASPVAACRWYLADAQTPRCAMVPGANVARRQLLAVFPLVGIAVAACLLGVLAQWRGRSRPGEVDRGSGLLAAGAAFLSLLLFSNSAGVALQDLAPLHVWTGGSLGMMEMILAILLCLAVGTAPART